MCRFDSRLGPDSTRVRREGRTHSGTRSLPEYAPPAGWSRHMRASPQGGPRPQPNVWFPLSASERGLGGEVWGRARHHRRPLPPGPPLRSGEGGENPRGPRGIQPDINEAPREGEPDSAGDVGEIPITSRFGLALAWRFGLALTSQ